MIDCQHFHVLPMHDSIPNNIFDTAFDNEVNFDENMQLSVSSVDLWTTPETFDTFEDEVELSFAADTEDLMHGEMQVQMQDESPVDVFCT